MNYYNEHDPKAAAWLRELIKHEHIPAGIVDERSIEDIKPSELDGFMQCHFFAGIGGWSLALRLGGWPEDSPIWTGSCPCQPFSTAGEGGGFADERHLWPAFHHLISQCQPPVVVGEQVASKDALAWLDLVRDDLEGAGYALGTADLCAAGIGAPHIRQRLWWVADRIVPGLEGHRRHGDNRNESGRVGAHASGSASASGAVDRVEHAGVERFERGEESGREAGRWDEDAGELRGMADANGEAGSGRGVQGPREGSGACSGAARERSEGLCSDGGVDDPNIRRHEVNEMECGIPANAGRAGGSGSLGSIQDVAGEIELPAGFRASTDTPINRSGPSPLHGFWRNADWLHCRDGKWRPVESGTFPLADGIPARVVRLRGYGNAIVPQVAAEFVKAFLETEA